MIEVFLTIGQREYGALMEPEKIPAVGGIITIDENRDLFGRYRVVAKLHNPLRLFLRKIIDA